MSGMSFKKANREAARKAKQQRKQEKRNARKQGTADKDIPEPGATEPISLLQNHEGAMAGDKSLPVHRAARGIKA